MTLSQAVNSLYRIAVAEGHSTSTLRLSDLAAWVVQELAARGLAGAETEATIPGGGRAKQWDVAWQHDGKHRLAVSLKSILRNLAGTVPNRIDDLMGEVANVQLYSPEIVVGYLMVLDTGQDKAGNLWATRLAERLDRLSGRRPPSWAVGMVEASALIRVDFTHGCRLLDGSEAAARMLDVLVAEVRARNPAVGGVQA